MRTLKLPKNFVAFVSDEDYDRVSEFKWFAVQKQNPYRTNFYAIAYIESRRKEYLHRFITGQTGCHDHLDGNGLNNVRENLRVVSKSENAHNSYRHRAKRVGVSWCESAQKWRARIKINYKELCIGFFDSKEDAYQAYEEARKLHQGGTKP